MKNVLAKLKEFWQFVKDSWDEVRFKVTWPTRDEVKGTTLIVLVTTLAFAAYLGAVDLLMFNLVDKFFELFA